MIHSTEAHLRGWTEDKVIDVHGVEVTSGTVPGEAKPEKGLLFSNLRNR